MSGSTALRGGHEHRDGRRLWFVRHGETTGGSSQRYFGATDVPLSDVGRDQVASLASLARGWRPRALLHSPLARAAESARIVLALLAERPGSIEAIDALREVDFGELEGLSAQEIESGFPGFFADWRSGRAAGYPGGETKEGFHGRVAAGLDQALQRHADGDLVFVVHRGVIKAALVHLLRLTWEHVRPWSLDLGSASSVVAVQEGGWTLERYNVIPPT